MLSKIKKNYFILIVTFLFIYFFFNLLGGDRGLISYLNKKELANIDPDDVEIDGIGKGQKQRQLSESSTNEAIARYASAGYLRNNFYVLKGGIEENKLTPSSFKNRNYEIPEKKNSKKNTNVLDKKVKIAKIQGYEGDACSECGNFTLVRNGTCLKCDTCGGTSGCS